MKFYWKFGYAQKIKELDALRRKCKVSYADIGFALGYDDHDEVSLNTVYRWFHLKIKMPLDVYFYLEFALNNYLEHGVGF